MSTAKTGRRAASGIAWAIQLLIAAQFALSGLGKFFDGEGWERRFRGWGYPDNVFLLVGAIELALAVLILVPRAWRVATLGTVVFMVGAAATHIRADDGHYWAAVVTGILAVAVYLMRSKLAAPADR
ncbi:MAG: DoxX family protein [Pseudomonadota bacterium]